MAKTVEELEAELKAERDAKAALEANKARLTDESFKFKQRAQDAEAKLDEAEKAKLKANGDLETLLQKERDAKKNLADTLETRTKSYVKEKLKSAVAAKAKDAHDIDMILKITDHKDLLKIDNDTLAVDGVDEFLGKCRESHAYLFTKSKLDTSGQEKPKDGTHDTSDEAYAKALEGCKTRKEMDDVRAKFGK